ncbi:MAG TPA: hypothetical protein VMG60_07285 [Burkholderiaceae bacterium]|nr:hypothetical protein [Burkholderiaceae bacterium]
MSNLIHRHLLSLGGAVLLALGSASAMADTGATAYSCHVLGDSSACAMLPAAPGSDTATRVVPGSYAQYLSHLGYSTDEAIAQARGIGEQPTLQAATSGATRLVPGSYARYLMYLGYSEDEAIAQARGIGEQPTLEAGTRSGPTHG